MSEGSAVERRVRALLGLPDEVPLRWTRDGEWMLTADDSGERADISAAKGMGHGSDPFQLRTLIQCAVFD